MQDGAENPMHFESYYVNPEDVDAGRGELIIRDEERHHLARVKRKRAGEVIQAVDGRGCSYESEILDMAGSETRCRIRSVRHGAGEPSVQLTVAQGVLKGDRFDWFVEKATEIGVSRIVPVLSERAVVDPGDRKRNRWRRIALSAMKQCGRSVWPEVTEPMTVQETLDSEARTPVRLIAHAGGSSVDCATALGPKPKTASGMTLLVGPEGGFTDEEVRSCLGCGFTPVRLGPRRLRAETAGVVFAALILSGLNELE